MANIPVERSGPPVWLLLLGALLVGGLIWLALELTDDEPDADEIVGVEDNTGPIDDLELCDDDPSGTVITDEMALYGDDPSADGDTVDGGTLGGVTVTRLEPGTAVDIDGARVLRVVGDSTFWIGRDDARRFLVVLASLGESELGAGGTDGVFDVDEGDTVSIDGAIAQYRDGDAGLSELTDDDTAMLRERNAYIRVDSRGDITVME